MLSDIKALAVRCFSSTVADVGITIGSGYGAWMVLEEGTVRGKGHRRESRRGLGGALVGQQSCCSFDLCVPDFPVFFFTFTSPVFEFVRNSGAMN